MDSPAPAESFHDVLVHYTDAQGLEGILSDNTLWATDGGHTNDAEELQTGLKILLKRFCKTEFWNDPDFRNNIPFDRDKLEEKEKAEGPNNFWGERIEEITTVTEHLNDQRTKYICSFSKTSKDKNDSYIQENGRLSQWRGYGDYGIVFNKDKLEKIVSTFPKKNLGLLELEPLLYVDPKEEVQPQTPLYTFLLNYLIIFINCYIAKRQDPDLSNSDPAFAFELAKIVFVLKNKGFEEEKEHRLLISYYNQNTYNQITREEDLESLEKKFTPIEPYEQIAIRRNRIVPYIDLFKNDPLPIEKILIGPAPEEEQQRRKAGVDILLRRLGKEHIPVHCSKIPYRG